MNNFEMNGSLSKHPIKILSLLFQRLYPVRSVDRVVMLACYVDIKVSTCYITVQGLDT